MDIAQRQGGTAQASGTPTTGEAARTSGAETRRVTVTLRRQDDERLREIARATSLNQNDAIRKALATEAFVQRTLGGGRKILVEDDKGNVREVEFVQ